MQSILEIRIQTLKPVFTQAFFLMGIVRICPLRSLLWLKVWTQIDRGLLIGPCHASCYWAVVDDTLDFGWSENSWPWQSDSHICDFQACMYWCEKSLIISKRNAPKKCKSFRANFTTPHLSANVLSSIGNLAPSPILFQGPIMEITYLTNNGIVKYVIIEKWSDHDCWAAFASLCNKHIIHLQK